MTAYIIALALIFGIIVQVIAQHLRVPGIVLLLISGVILGPEGLNLIQPQLVGTAMPALLGYAVAVILFEGGMNLKYSRLRRESLVIRQLITVGAVITAAAATIIAKLALDWSWSIAVLFGTLVIVTGPTVINPLLKRIKIRRSLATILEAEGVLIDPIGAIIALITLEAVISPVPGGIFTTVFDLFLRLVTGAIVGLLGGLLIALALKPRKLIPDNLTNVFTLTAVLALFHVSNMIQHESGIGAATVAGIAVGNFSRRVLRELMEFKEQLTIMLIGMLFILLAADVSLEDIRHLGWGGAITLVAVMFVVRPLNIWASTVGSELSWHERAFLVWLSPRGIVAAAVASLFAIALDEAGIDGGAELRAMVFLVITATVVVQGLLAGPVASLLNVKRQSNQGYLILGASEVGRALALVLQEAGERVAIVDSNADACHAAEQDGLKVVFGNAFDEKVAARSQLEDMAGCVGLTANEEVNFLFASMAKDDYKVPRQYVTLHLDKGHITPAMISERGFQILFGIQRDIDLWSVRLRRKLAVREIWRANEDTTLDDLLTDTSTCLRAILPLAVHNGSSAAPVGEKLTLKEGQELDILLFEEMRIDAVHWLEEHGLAPVVKTDADQNTL